MQTYQLSRDRLGGHQRSSFWSRIDNAVQLMRQRARSRQAAEQLLYRDDRILDDIGLTRGDVLAALETASTVDAAEFLANRRQQRLSARRAGREL